MQYSQPQRLTLDAAILMGRRRNNHVEILKQSNNEFLAKG
jgi:hypothetical protein